MEKEKKLNLKTLSYSEEENGTNLNKKKRSKGKPKLPTKTIGMIALILILACILSLIFSKKNSPKYIVNDFYKIAKTDLTKAKNKYNEKYDFNEEVDQILSSRFKYKILDSKDITTPKQKENKIKIVEVKTKLYNINKRKVKTDAANQVSKDLKLGSDEYNKEFLKNLKEAVKKEKLEEKETIIRLKKVNNNWYIIDSGLTDLI